MGTYGDLPAVEVGNASVGVADRHEEEALAGHERRVVPPWRAQAKAVAQFVPVQPAGTGFEKLLGCILWRLRSQRRDDVVCEYL